jgi:Leucine-rich repeat (LRR) protein
MKTDRNILRKSAIMLALIVSSAFLLEACAKEPSPLERTGIITMTTKASEVRFSLEGAKDITIDWGDGKKSNVRDAIVDDISGWFYFAHDYSGADAHNIVITGSNVTKLYCGNNSLTALDVSRCTALDDLMCNNNQLTALDVSKNTALHGLDCNYNKITKLDVSKNTVLWQLCCVGNQLTTTALNDLFSTLPDYSETDNGGVIFIMERNPRAIGNPGNSDCDRNIAEKRGWIFMTER